ncbi:Catalase [Rubellimicrobium mesophilum DSM 19309]|uniref:Catalase n=1 Tax=Rubellimicrobium mesophilum DSM 19309 TaxID=442562 RepID=A0A017HRB4_9RHOB|nr:catalase [Rubellimicrobium mesophilum]EYD76698.1 Catalase [Rubellimicrobium mesophilum DSM 19309]
MAEDKKVGLTTRQGHPVYDNQNTRSVGSRGPLVLEDYHYLEKMSHFDRERIPERVVHARGAAAHGTFFPTGMMGDEPIEKYSRAKVFRAGTQTPIFLRFSTVINGGHSPETLRDPRGFAIKFYTETGNWDLVGNNLKVFFIRDPLKFPDMIHAFKPDPITNRQSNERFFDFVSMTPEATHMVTWVFSPWGIPANYREMQGSGVNTYKLVDPEGRTVLCKFHFQPRQGVRNLTQAEAQAIQAKDHSHATGDLYDAIARGEFPEWDMFIQIMDDNEHPELDWDPLDVTKLWPEDQFPLRHVGHIQLNRNPSDYHNEVEQAAFGTGVLVDGIDFSEDKMLQGRTFAYSDTQRYRVGPNYLQLPINAPRCPYATNQRGGQMSYHVDGAEQGANPHVNYEPSNFDGLREQERLGPPPRTYWAGAIGRQRIERTNDFAQAGVRYRSYSDEEREELISNLVGALGECAPVIQDRMIRHFTLADADYGRRVAEGLGRSVSSEAAE